MAEKTHEQILTMVREALGLTEQDPSSKRSHQHDEGPLCAWLREFTRSGIEERCKAKAFTIRGLHCEGEDGCREVDLQKVQPCFQLRWGDGPQDVIETNDFEVLCLTACNHYSNVSFCNLRVVAALFLPNFNLPNGNPAAQLVPAGELCFGDLGPCTPGDPGRPSCVTRELALKTEGLPAGAYYLVILPCYKVEYHAPPLDLEDIFDYFPLNVTAS